MAFDAHKNLAISTVVTPPAPATSGTTVTVPAGEGDRFAAPPFNVTIWPVSQPPTPSNAEVARVTARSGDVLTLVRAQEGSSARSIIAGDLIAATITAKALTDVESGVNFPLLTTPGAVTAGGHVVAGVMRQALTTGVLTLSGGPDIGSSAYVNLYASGHATSPGALDLVSPGLGGFSIGSLHAAGPVKFITTGAERGRMHPSGGFSWAGTTDPGAGNLSLAGAPFGVAARLTVRQDSFSSGLACITCIAGTDVAAGGGYYLAFVAATGAVIGSVGQAAGKYGVLYNTTSDQRLKTDRGLVTDPEVLRATRVHHFTWTADGTVGRGVFAQEAIAVLPAAVSIGTDERDDDGRLKHPWGVDYSKYVPDLIAGWQHHDRAVREIQQAFGEVESMRNRIAFLEGAIVTMRDRPTLINRLRTAIRSFGQWWAPSWV